MSPLAGYLALLTLAAPADTPLRMGGGAKPTEVCRLAFAPDGKTVAWAGSGAVCLFDTTSGAFRRRLKTDAGDAKCLAFTPDGKTVAVVAGGSVYLFDANKDEKKAEWQARS